MSLISNLRKYKILKMAIFDWVATFFGALIINILLNKYTNIYKGYNEMVSYLITLIILVILGIIVHYVLGVNTRLGCYLRINKCVF